MLNKIINVITTVLVICLAAEAVRQVWNPDKDDKKEDKKEENK
ncbi:MAG: hypothetical protein VZR53_12630 [Prevotella sp.]|nr:hypothetical protein [Prevotella sp.]